MTDPALRRAMEATWPPAAARRLGCWTIRTGLGGGQRVSAASVTEGWDGSDPARAEAAMRALGQDPIFLLDAGDDALDAALAARVWTRHDPVVLLAAACADLEGGVAGVSAQWPPDAAACALWDAGGIGPARRGVMARVAGARTVLLARDGDAPAGVAFVAVEDDWAILHALEVSPAHRRRGAGARIMAAAARWAGGQGAGRLALAVTEANGPARALYARLGMQATGGYHYRLPPGSAK